MTTFTSDKTKSGKSTRYLETGTWSVSAYYSASASTSAGDVIQMVNVPAGAKVVMGWFVPSVTGGFAVGDGLDGDRYIDSGSVVANAVTQFSLMPDYEYSADDTIDVLINNAEAAGNYKLTVILAADDQD